ncbi:MAG: prolyl oligopeptidase family serine peptidase [Acidobacteriota bacterium]
MKRINLHSIIAVIAISSLFTPLASFAQQPAKFELTVDSIMRGPDLIGYDPTEVRWSQDSQRVYFRWKQAGEPRLKEPDLYVVNRDGSGLHKLSEVEAKQAPPATGELSLDKRLTVFVENSDIYLYDHTKSERRQITVTTEAESDAHFTRDQKHIYFTRQNNLFLLALNGGSLRQLTDIRTSGAGNRSAGGEEAQKERDGSSQQFIKKEERELLESVRELAEQREQQEAKRKQEEKRKTFNLPAGQTVTNLSLSPDNSYVIATMTQSGNAKTTIVPNYVTETAYTEDIPSRNKVGDLQAQVRMAVIATQTGELKWIDHGQRSESVTQQAGSNQQSTKPDQQSPREREVQLFGLRWSEDGQQAAIMARATDNKDRWIMLLDPATSKTTVLDQIHDDAWVDGPGAFTLGWLPDNKHVYYQSERDGYAHLYTVSIPGGKPSQLTTGTFEVSSVTISSDKTKFYFSSSEVSFAERHLYSMPINGGTRTRITALPGNNDTNISPDDTMIAIVRSYSNKPPELYLAANQPMAEAKQVTTSPIPEFFGYNWIDPPIVTFTARDGAKVSARLYKPANFKKGGPAVLFVHGAGYLQNVHKWWSFYYREYMFHHLLMERGYIVLDVDYRGSAGYGRDWRTGIYRHMGGKDLSDQVDAVRYLISEHGIDAKRVGIYGGSYGGFITLMAMFTEPEVFAAGASLRPVTDWAHYNHPYTSNILNVPQEDSEAYRRSSPIYFAAGLKGALLICHGMVDVNVHFQDTVRLAQRLIELRKENWELAVYPIEGHGFTRATSWADEYKRILKLFETNLRKEVPKGKVQK